MLSASIMGHSNIESWIGVAKAVADAGADALELNGMPEKHIGAAIGQDAALEREMTRAIKSEVKFPLIVKFTPNVMDIVSITQAALEGNADALAAINTV